MVQPVSYLLFNHEKMNLTLTSMCWAFAVIALCKYKIKTMWRMILKFYHFLSCFFETESHCVYWLLCISGWNWSNPTASLSQVFLYFNGALLTVLINYLVLMLKYPTKGYLLFSLFFLHFHCYVILIIAAYFLIVYVSEFIFSITTHFSLMWIFFFSWLCPSVVVM